MTELAEAARPFLAEGWPHTGQGKREPTCQPPKRIWWSDERREQFEQMWRDDVDVEEMADFFETSAATIYSKASQWKLGRRRPITGPRKGKKRRAKRKLRADPTGQRRKTRLASTEGPKIRLEPHDPRYRAGTTVFPTSVVPVARQPQLLKSGHNSYKIGKSFTKGPWKGMPIFTLTLEERATCPRSCQQWATCYGNNMPFAQRIHDDGSLTRRLWGELAALAAQHPAGFVLRLHVLGDFFSVPYVDFWRDMLGEFAALRIFGFTARRPDDPIGRALIHLTADQGDRFKMRFSGGGYETHCAEVVDRADEATGIICPAEKDPDRSCATCALCISSDRTISFMRH